MKFRDRLSKYLFGVLIGLGLAYFILGDKSWSWLPKNVIRDEINKKGVIMTKDIACKLQCNEIDYKNVKEVIATGYLNMPKSGRQENPRWYRFESEGEIQSMKVVLTDSTSTITEVNLVNTKDCDC